MKSFIECGKCNKQWKEDLNGYVKCPCCGSDKIKRMVMGGPKPDWFEELA